MIYVMRSCRYLDMIRKLTSHALDNELELAGTCWQIDAIALPVGVSLCVDQA